MAGTILEHGIYKVVPVEHITVDWDLRKRKQYNLIEDLAANIVKTGLINPLTVYSISGDAPYLLVAGGRRLKAILHAKIETVAVHIYNRELSTLELFAIEMYENLQRSNLPFNEEVRLTKELNAALVEAYGEAIPGKKNSPGHSIQKTAQMLGVSAAKISTDMKLAQAMEDFPELQLAKSKNKLAAMKRLKRFANIGQATTIATKHNIKSEDTGYYVGDFFENTLPSSSFHFIETDPVYGVDIVHNKRSTDKQFMEDNYHEIDEKDYPQFLEKLIKECYRLGAQNSWLILWCGPQWISTINTLLHSVGYETNTRPCIWKKGTQPGQTHLPGSLLGSAYEMFIYARKGVAQIRAQGRSNIFDYYPINPQEKELMHPTARPIPLIKDIISTFCWPGFNILVPFLGSGNTILAARELGYKACGFDLSTEYRDSFINRYMEKEHV